MRIMQSRRNFLTTLSAAGAAGFMGSRRSFADEGPPETTTSRLAPAAGGGGPAARGGFHRHPLRVPAGILHLPADGGARRRPSRQFLRGNPRLSHGRRRARYGVVGVGLDPKSDFEWVISPDGKPMEVFAEGKADAFLAFPPEPQELRARDIGRVLISTVQDKPWSQYLCCVLYGGGEFVRDHPIATKRYLRAVLKAVDYCADEPEKAARRLVDAGSRYDYALQTLTEIQYRSGETRIPRTRCASMRSSCTRRA